MIEMTYAQYDEMEELCEKIYNKNENEYIDEDRRFNGRYQYPTVSELQKMKAEENIEKYFPYLFYYYTQDFSDKFAGMPSELKEYQASVKMIRDIMNKNIVFTEDE